MFEYVSYHTIKLNALIYKTKSDWRKWATYDVRIDNKFWKQIIVNIEVCFNCGVFLENNISNETETNGLQCIRSIYNKCTKQRYVKIKRKKSMVSSLFVSQKLYNFIDNPIIINV